MILGQSGSGKSVFSKSEIISVYLNNPDDQILIVDPQSEYGPVILKKKLFEEIVPIQFEGCSFLAVKDFHALLSPFYGDYMQLPPEKDRIPKMNNWIHFYRK